MMNNLSDPLLEFENLLDYLKDNESNAPLQLRDISALTRVQEELESIPFLKNVLKSSKFEINNPDLSQSQTIIRSASNFFSGYKIANDCNCNHDFIAIPKIIKVYRDYTLDTMDRLKKLKLSWVNTDITKQRNQQLAGIMLTAIFKQEVAVIEYSKEDGIECFNDFYNTIKVDIMRQDSVRENIKALLQEFRTDGYDFIFFGLCRFSDFAPPISYVF